MVMPRAVTLKNKQDIKDHQSSNLGRFLVLGLVTSGHRVLGLKKSTSHSGSTGRGKQRSWTQFLRCKDMKRRFYLSNCSGTGNRAAKQVNQVVVKSTARSIR
jgi:hypothetical protein